MKIDLDLTYEPILVAKMALTKSIHKLFQAQVSKTRFFDDHFQTSVISRLWASNPGYLHKSCVLHLQGAHGKQW